MSKPKLPAGLAKRGREIDAKAAAARERTTQPAELAKKESQRRAWYIRRGLPVPTTDPPQ